MIPTIFRLTVLESFAQPETTTHAGGGVSTDTAIVSVRLRALI
jgi:hypothetical protein